ncbi:MAG: hypothetical protein O9272_16315 [Brevundimonas sp.]|jgi:hypothetical protein|nr:hypothetical protein [Brevundimonas sp.]
MPKKSGFGKIPTIKPIRPVKPIDKIQNIKPVPKLGQSEGVAGHWRLDPRTNKYVWVKAHWRKP